AKTVPGLKELIDARVIARRELRKIQDKIDEAPDEQKEALKTEQVQAQMRFKALTEQLINATTSQPDAKKAVLDWEATLIDIVKNRAKQKAPDDKIKATGNAVQFWQELGGLAGRIVLAILLVMIPSRRLLLRLFQVPGLIIFPLTYWYLY